jgi:NADPH-dependent 2,4-dienoyl-CoA reductase/sulfur reductase-like enzyme
MMQLYKEICPAFLFLRPFYCVRSPEELLLQSEQDVKDIDHTDYVVIGSGIGGLSCAAMLSYCGYKVTVLESHYLPGGAAHTFERKGFKFDAGPSLGMEWRLHHLILSDR